MRKHRASDKLGMPVGLAEAAPLFERQPSDLQSHITLLTIPEAAELLTISVSSTRRLQQERRIPFFKVGGSVRFAKHDLVSYLAKQRVSSLG
jgi:excisionase family DNA binding protein